MPAERAPMRKVREVLRLRHALGVSERQIAVTIGVSRSTVGEYLRRAAVIGITWPVPEGLDDAELERRLFTPPTFDETPARPLPDWPHVHKELKRRGVTLLLLWEEYRAEHADGYGYSRFCDLYRRMAPDHLAHNAADARACREVVCRLRWRHGAGLRCRDRERNGVLISSSRCWEPPTTPMRRRAGRKGLPTGSGRTSTP